MYYVHTCRTYTVVITPYTRYYVHVCSTMYYGGKGLSSPTLCTTMYLVCICINEERRALPSPCPAAVGPTNDYLPYLCIIYICTYVCILNLFVLAGLYIVFIFKIYILCIFLYISIIILLLVSSWWCS